MSGKQPQEFRVEYFGSRANRWFIIPIPSDPVGAIGIFWNLLPVCSNGIEDDVTAIEKLSATLSMVDTYSLYPIDCLSDLVGVKTGGITYIAFNFINFHNQSYNSKKSDFGGGVVEVRHSVDRFHHALKITISRQQGSCISGYIEYESQYFCKEEMQEFFEDFKFQLKQLVDC
ncbi:hypothetical protein ACL7TT_07020 [Microbulbifer sp. 2304DJ12-6]